MIMVIISILSKIFVIEPLLPWFPPHDSTLHNTLVEKVWQEFTVRIWSEAHAAPPADRPPASVAPPNPLTPVLVRTFLRDNFLSAVGIVKLVCRFGI